MGVRFASNVFDLDDRFPFTIRPLSTSSTADAVVKGASKGEQGAEGAYESSAQKPVRVGKRHRRRVEHVKNPLTCDEAREKNYFQI